MNTFDVTLKALMQRAIALLVAGLLCSHVLAIAVTVPPQPAATALEQAVRKRPFPDYAIWWPVGDRFASFMSEAIATEWAALPDNDGSPDRVRAYASAYLKLVYGREGRPALVEDFIRQPAGRPLQSGEFDALSYAFFRSAFELIETHVGPNQERAAAERRLFTRRVGRRFFTSLRDHLKLALPGALRSEADFLRLKAAVQAIGAFLKEQGYFRDHVAFRFDVDAPQRSGRIVQPEPDFLKRLAEGRAAYALFEMGYPVILPSAVYLHATKGEAQHHSSRTIEELFGRLGCAAGETDFDPSEYPAEMVVELWEIRCK